MIDTARERAWQRYYAGQALYKRIGDEWSALAARVGLADYRDALISKTPDAQPIVDALEARSRAWLQRYGAPEGSDFEYRGHHDNSNVWVWADDCYTRDCWSSHVHDCAHYVNVLIMRTVAARRWRVDPKLIKATSYTDPRAMYGGLGSYRLLSDPLLGWSDLATTTFYTPPHTLFQAKLEHNLQHHVMQALLR
jgi:hypothetical protein